MRKKPLWLQPHSKIEPKIALYDIETAPSLGYFWGKLHETDIIKVRSPWYMLCFSYRWLGERKIHTHSLRDYPNYRRNLEDDRRLVGDLHSLFDQADILIAHNGDRFDQRKANAKFIKHGLKPPSFYRSIDTLKIARKHFLFESSRLGALGEYLGLGGKLPHTGFDLWEKVMRGDDKAWSMMEDYNRRDVDLLEKVYLKLRGYASVHPDMSMYAEGKWHKNCCPRCSSKQIHKFGFWVSNARRYQRMRCFQCGYSYKGELLKEYA